MKTLAPTGESLRGRVWPSARLEPYVRAAQLILAVLFAALAVLNVIGTANGFYRDHLGLDFNQYVDGARRWLETGTPYVASEIGAPFEFGPETFLHPPIALLLFAPFTVLPWFLYWLIPIGGTAALVAWWRPDRWTWPLMALLLNWPRFGGAVVVGNSDLWIAFFVACGLAGGWPMLLLAIKPSIAPVAAVEVALLALAGEIMRPWLTRFLVAGVVFLLVCALFGSLWLDWLAVVRHSPADPLYSLGALPWLAVPIVAWLGRRRRPLAPREREPQPDRER